MKGKKKSPPTLSKIDQLHSNLSHLLHVILASLDMYCFHVRQRVASCLHEIRGLLFLCYPPRKLINHPYDKALPIDEREGIEGCSTI